MSLIRDVRSIVMLCVGLLIAVLIVAHPVSAQTSKNQGPVKMMIVGDSITAGQTGDYTWRYWFYTQERAAGVDLSLVGPYTGLATPDPDHLGTTLSSPQHDNHDYSDPDFDQHCLCLWGYSIQSATAAMYDAVAQGKPDYLLVLLGRAEMDYWGASNPGAAATSMGPLITAARSANPDIRIVLGQVPADQNDITYPDAAQKDAAFNADLALEGQEWSTPQSPIVRIDTGIDPVTDLYDDSHPNSQGEVKIAAAFVNALATDFSVGAPFPVPLPSPPLGPQQAPRLTAKGGTHSATLTWTSSLGAWDYVIWGHDLTTGAYLLPQTSQPTRSTVKLKPGTYSFHVQPEKGSKLADPPDAYPALGKSSNTVTVTVR